MLAMGPPLFIVRAVQTGGNSHRSRSSSPPVFRKLPAAVRDHSSYPPNTVATSGRHTHPIVKTEKPCSSYISQTRLPHTPKATCSHSYNVRCWAASFSRSNLGKRLFKVGDEVIRVLQTNGQSDQVGDYKYIFQHSDNLY